MILVFLLLALFTPAAAVTCKNGYSDFIGNGLCYKRYLQPMLHSDAENTCNRDGARLVHIRNAYENTQMSHNTNSYDMWVGLRCTRSSTSNCYWDDDGTSVSTSYFSFCSAPDIADGYCILMSGTRSCWRSANCEGMFLPFVCQYDPVNGLNCGPDYKVYNGACYKFYTDVTPTSFWNAEYQCQAECGHLVSIHDVNENNFLVYTAEVPGPSRTNLAYIGLQRQTGSNFYWTDYSPYNYNNFVNAGAGTNKCAALAVFDDKVFAGKWTEVDCNDQLSYICKKDNECESTTYYDDYTIEPLKCTTRYYNERGTIYSPGYPTMYPDIPQACEYRLTVSQGQVQLTFDEIVLDTNSNIQLYSDFSIASTPFRTISGPCRGCLSSISSPTDELRMQFNSDRLPSDTKDYYRWNARFENVMPGCGQNLTGHGTISSKNYPNQYENNLKCSYLLHTQYDGSTAPNETAIDTMKRSNGIRLQQVCDSPNYDYSTEYPAAAAAESTTSSWYYYRILLQFGAIDTEQCCDKIRIYDGPTTNYPLIAEISGHYPAGCMYESTGNYMLVTFTTDVSVTDRGWSANFETIYGY